ncbi:MAG: hypothetical protein ACFBSG_04085 [Leptolyngbyaceae cyanobacterium]
MAEIVGNHRAGAHSGVAAIAVKLGLWNFPLNYRRRNAYFTPIPNESLGP